jgi:hypothetical protein
MRHRIHRSTVALILGLAPVAGCAHNAASSSVSIADDRVKPPEVITETIPDLQLPFHAAGRTIDIRYEVSVDSAGHALLATLHTSGSGATENESAISAWLRGALFRPALREGQPVDGVYHGRYTIVMTTRP